MSDKPKAPGYVYPTHDIEIINPDEIYNKLFILHFVHGTYGVVADAEDTAIENFGDYALKHAPGYILGDLDGCKTSAEMRQASATAYLEVLTSEGHTIADEQAFPVNGGDFYLNEMPARIDVHEYTEVERVAHCCNGSITPYIAGPVDMYEIEDENGEIHFQQAQYGFGHAPEKDGGVMTVTMHRGVYAARLGRTDDLMFETIKNACDYLIEMYGNT